MTEKGIKQAMQALKFSGEWEASAWLNVELLETLFAEFRKGKDKNTEHYRYQMFRKGIAGRIPLSDEDVEQCLTLAKKDSDMAMIGSVMWMLVEMLSSAQREKYLPQIYIIAPRLEKRDKIEVLYDEIRAGMTEELFQRCLASGVTSVFHHIADSKFTTIVHLERLNNHLGGKDKYVAQKWQKCQFYQKYNSEGMSENLFLFTLESQNIELQRFLIEKEELLPAQLETLAAQTTNKKIRERALGQIKHWTNLEKRP